MDGTFYLGNQVLPGAIGFMNYLQRTGRDYLFLTNNSSASADYYAEKLTKMGWPTEAGDILTSGEATALYLKKNKPNARIFLMGTPALEAEFKNYGFILTSESPDYVVLGFDKTLNYEKLAIACDLVRRGVEFIATHPDKNCPTESGFIPDCGAMIEFIWASTGKRPHIIGKPNRDIIEAVFSKKNYFPSQMAIIGDRLYTDIVTGRNAGIASILVLSGETKLGDICTAEVVPNYIFADLGALAKQLSTEESQLP